MACVHTLVREVKSLISLPELGIKISTMLRSPDASMSAIAKLIEQDTAISAALLRIANSSLLNRGKEVVSINRALMRLGADQTAELAIGISVANAFNGIAVDKVSMKNFWRHSLKCAAASRLIATKILLPQQDAAFSAGLLHDLGRLVLLCYRPEEMNRVIRLTEGDVNTAPLSWLEAENQVLDFNHTEAGELLAWQWKLPAVLSRTMRYHHNPVEADKDQMLIWTVHLANAIAEADEAGADFINPAAIAPETLNTLGMSHDDVATIINEIKDGSDDLYSLMPVAA